MKSNHHNTAIQQKKGVYFPTTTAEQRRTCSRRGKRRATSVLLVAKASLRSTFYHWRPRFVEKGYKAIEKPLSNAPKNPRCTPAPIVEEVRHVKRKNPRWGKERIAAYINQQHGEKTIGSSTVRRILTQAGLQ
ncbi:MAG: helix-turn-helix domain-containing protein [Caldilineaceae bacterium]